MAVNLSFVWAGLIVLFSILEIATVGLLCIWFALGSVAALLVSLFTNSFTIQLIAFMAVSALTLIFTRPVLQNHLIKRKTPTNADMVIDTKALVTEAIAPNLPGRVKANGLSWAARSNSTLEEGDWCTVKAIEGATLTVEPVEDTSTVNI